MAVTFVPAEELIEHDQLPLELTVALHPLPEAGVTVTEVGMVVPGFTITDPAIWVVDALLMTTETS